MANFSSDTLAAIESVAHENGLEPAILLAVVEVESAGRAFAIVGGRKEPLIRFEGHYFDRLLTPSRRERARAQGLASPRAGAIKNPRGQADRWALLTRARAVDEDAALQSVSWGVGQVMGLHWKALGYASVQAMVREARSGVAGQVRLMMRFVKVNGLMAKLRSRDWAGFAYRYNGPAYRKNHYDTRMAAAYARHRSKKLKSRSVPGAGQASAALLRLGARGEAVKTMQRMLTSTGYPVRADGVFGGDTLAALISFQKAKALRPDGIYGPLTAAALAAAMPRIISQGVFLRQLFALLLRLLPVLRRLG